MQAILDMINSADLVVGKSRGKGFGALLLTIIVISGLFAGGAFVKWGFEQVQDPAGYGRIK
jgi:hypothetical protein